MNKLLVSDIIKLSSGNYILENKNEKLDITINGQVNIYLINSNVAKLTIHVEDGSILNIYKYDKQINNSVEVSLYQNNNSKIFYNASYTSVIDNELIINNYIKGNNNNSQINIRNISNLNLSKININVRVDENTINNIALEDLRGINKGGNILIEPNIICSSHEIEANHLTTIGGLDQNMINYLMSKGLSLKASEELLLKGFRISNMDEFIIKNYGGDLNA